MTATTITATVPMTAITMTATIGIMTVTIAGIAPDLNITADITPIAPDTVITGIITLTAVPPTDVISTADGTTTITDLTTDLERVFISV